MEGQAHPLPDYAAIVLEDGTSITERIPAGMLPIGLHSLRATSGERPVTVAVRPKRFDQEGPIQLALSIFMNNLASQASWGVGDYGDLAAIASRAAPLGVSYLALGPTNAVTSRAPVRTSPYSPSSRLFKSLLHLRPEMVDGWGEVAGALEGDRCAATRCNDQAQLDLTAVRDIKLRALRELFSRALARGVDSDPAFRAFREEGDPELSLFAIFTAAEFTIGSPWWTWPHELRHPRRAKDSGWARHHHELILFFEWCQWQLDVQMAHAAGQGCGLITDLPVGAPHDSADSWMWQDAIAGDFQLGSPADYFNPNGHAWGLAPIRPDALAGDHYRIWVAILRRNLRHASGIRIDHAFGLFQQYWLTRDGQDGRFVPQPSRPLLDILSIEAFRAGAIVITEELGTEPPSATTTLRHYGFLGLRPFISDQFDPQQPPAYMSLTCHDLPSLAGCLIEEAPWALDGDFRRRARARVMSLLPEHVEDRSLLPSLAYSSLARFPCRILALWPDDLMMIPEPFNLPGVPEEEWPSFGRRLPDSDRLIDALRSSGIAAT